MKFQKKLLIISIIATIVLASFATMALATNASLSFKASNEAPYVGESVTVTATATAGGFNLTLSGNGQTKQIVGQTDKKDNVSKSESITFTPTEAKTYTFTLTGDYTDYNTDEETSVNKTIKITAKKKEETPTPQEDPKKDEQKTPETTVTFKDVNETVYATTDVNVRKGPSTSEASLGSLSKNKSTTRTGVGSNGWSRVKYNGGTAYIKSDYLTTTKPKEDETFTDVNETVYATRDVNIRKGPSTSTTALGKLEKGKSVTRTGVGNTGWSRVTYNNETAYISSDYLTTTAPENAEKEEKTSNANLKRLEIVGQNLVPEFSPDVTSYTMKVGKDVEKLQITAEAEDANATVSIKGNEGLKDGENTVTISVSAGDGTVKIYEIKVEKTADETTNETATLGLKSLEIKGLDKGIKFKQNVYNYEVQIEDAMTKLDIVAVANNAEATVEILGNEDLQKGDNIITIIVSAKDSEEKVTYQIKAIKGEIDDEEEEKATNILEKIPKLYIYIGVFAVLLIALIIVVVYAIKHRANDYEDDYEDDLEEIPNELRKNSEGLYNQEIDEEPITEENIPEEEIPNTKIDYDYEEPEEPKRRNKKGRHF